MLLLVTQILGLIGTIAPLFTTSAHVASAIKVATEVLPVVIAAGTSAWEQFKPAIDAIRQSGAATPEQLAELDAIEARGDAAFDAALANALAEDSTTK